VAGGNPAHIGLAPSSLYVTDYRQKYHYHETASSPIELPFPI